MNYAILGNGWLGNMIAEYTGGELLPGQMRDNREAVKNYDVVINTAAKTPIDWCEQHKQETFDANVTQALELAQTCAQHNIAHVFFSSACVFESADETDWKDETAEKQPACFYTKTKDTAEDLIAEAAPDTLIVRLRLPISETPHPRNTIDKLLGYPKINDQQESLTIVEDMLPALTDVIVPLTNPVTDLGLAGLAVYMKIIDRRNRNRNERLQERIERLEARYFPDGGQIDDE